MTDYMPEPDLDRVAEVALTIVEKLREDDPRRLFNELVGLAEKHPAKYAQVTMCLAAWFNPAEPVQTLWQRVESIPATRREVNELDELAIDAAVNGFPMNLGRAEQMVAARRLVDKGVNAKTVAWLIGVNNDRQVWRLLEDDRQAVAS